MLTRSLKIRIRTTKQVADGHKREQLQSMRRQVANISLVGILLAIFAVVGLADPIDLSGSISLGTIGSIVLMVIMVLLILKNAVWTKSKEK
mgnify:CR=1 FL=1